AAAALGQDRGPAERLAAAERLLGRVAADAAGRLDPVLERLGRAATDAAEAEVALDAAARELAPDPQRPERVEERLFGLRGAARKHRTDADGLVAVRAALAERLQSIATGDQSLANLRSAATAARAAFDRAAAEVGARRRKAAVQFDRAVNA